MAISDNPKIPRQVANSALAKMTELDIQPEPRHFTIWYHYFDDSFPDLSREINLLLADSGGMSEAQCLGLFEKYFTAEAESSLMHDVSQKLDRAMEQAVQYLNEAGEDAAEFGETLAGASDDLTKSKEESDPFEILKEVIEATREMQVRQKTMENQLRQSSTEIGRLQEEVEETRREATTDGLTGLANRKLFDTRIRDDAGEAEESGDELCLMMLDIDHFKNFNDNHGHQIGDHVLRLLAAILKSGLRGRDLAARYGGEEFGVILPQTSITNALRVAENIRQQVSQKKIVNRGTGESLGKITLSIGVSQYNVGEKINEFIERADVALYAAKNGGRNQVMSERDIGNPSHAAG